MICHNISMDSAKCGFWVNVPHENTVYIQITDPGYAFEPMKNNFAEIHRFEFLDDEFEGVGHENSIADEQSEELAKILRRASQDRKNVIVSCHAGLCRSGAITDIMVSQFGYKPGPGVRSPNLLVRNKIMKSLGMNYDPNFSPFNNYDPIWE